MTKAYHSENLVYYLGRFAANKVNFGHFGPFFDENDKIFKNTQKIKNLALQVLDNIILHYLAKF